MPRNNNDDEDFARWHDYGHRRGYHAHQQGRHGQMNEARERGAERGGEIRSERAQNARRDSRGYAQDEGQGGWFGDSEGHSEASHRGWQNPSHGESGWFGDSEGHSEASQRGWQNPEHGESGWFGDSEGHSQAARRGWGEDVGGRNRSRSRDDDDDYRGSRSSGRNGSNRQRDDQGRFVGR